MNAIDQKTTVPPLTWRRRTVARAGVELAVFEHGEAATDRPTVVLVHGWPDTHHLWSAVVPMLVERYHVVSYDTRGYGESDRPDGDAAYRLTELAADLYAVIDAVSPELPVHVVAHDWGSVQTWEAVSQPGAELRIASFMSVSGPNMDHLAIWTRERLRRPTPDSLKQALSQGASSAYTIVFQLPIIPKILLRITARPKRWQKILKKTEGTDPRNLDLAPTFRADSISGLRYYRANIRGRLIRPNPRNTKVPVFEIVNARDVALRKAIYVNSHRYVERLWRNDTATGHWLPYSSPAYLADMAIAFIETVRGTGTSPVIERARQDGEHRLLSGKLAVITGAGSGIGRRTASMLADNGAEVIVTDRDLEAAQNSAAAITSAGALAHAYQLDVTDDDAFQEFADEVTRHHGVADLIVNIADLDQAGWVLETTDQEAHRLIDSNLLGVVAGSRIFGQKMIERGVGGNIVNMAAVTELTTDEGIGGYAASRAGVLMFTESLSIELAKHRISVSAICPDIADTSTASDSELTSFDDQIREQLEVMMINLHRRRKFIARWRTRLTGGRS